MLHAIQTSFCDDNSGRDPFHGYTDGRRWNGFECPHLTLHEFKRVLDTLVEWGAEKSYEVIDDRNVRVHGVSEGVGFVMSAKCCTTTDGDRWLFDCGGAWTFVKAVEATSSTTDVDIDMPPTSCTHPEHRLGTRGGLRKHQRACLQCGKVIVISSHARRGR